jgi:hypothetical protein
MQTNQATDQDFNSLDERVRHAQALLTGLCRHPLLLNMLKTARHWAIVGGAVRDALLIASNKDTDVYAEWKDIDIALTKLPRKGLLCRPDRKNSKVNIAKNNFGGLKVYTDELGTMDLWVWRAENEIAGTKDFWFKQLESVDFGINAVAFIWPACEIIIHPQWERDLLCSQIEKVADYSPLKVLQPIRAIALAAKMELKLASSFNLGSKAASDLHWLLNLASDTEVNIALNYLEEKLLAERWPSYTLVRFLQLCSDHDCPRDFYQRLVKLLSEYEASL